MRARSACFHAASRRAYALIPPHTSQALTGKPLVAPSRTVRPSGQRCAIVAQAAATKQIARRSVPLKLEEGDMPMNTFNNKKPFTATIKSVETITGPEASGETCNIVIETRGEIPFWEGQSYGVIPPVCCDGGGVGVVVGLFWWHEHVCGVVIINTCRGAIPPYYNPNPL